MIAQKFFMMQEIPQSKAHKLIEWLQQQGWSSTQHNKNNAPGVNVQKIIFSNGSDMCVHMESDLWDDWMIDGPKSFIFDIRQRFDINETLYERCMNRWVLSSADRHADTDVDVEVDVNTDLNTDLNTDSID